MAALARVLTLPLPAGTRAVEAVLCLAVAAFVVAGLRAHRVRGSGGVVLLVLYALAPALLASLALRLAAAVMPDYPMFAVLVYAAILVSIDVTASRPAVLAAGAVVVAVFAQLWVSTVALDSAEVGSLLVAAALLLGVLVVAVAHGERLRRRLGVEAVRGQVYAAVARHLGTERDVASVVTAVLRACAEMFPETTFGAVMLLDDADGLLKSPAPLLGPDGVGGDPAAPALELQPGEGLAGQVVAAGRAQVWSTALEVSTTEATLREANRDRRRGAGHGFARCAVGAPLESPGAEVFGCILLSSDRREGVWSSADLPVVEAVAAEASRAVERARRHEADVDQALLDSVTGLVSHRRLLAVVDKEVARADRAGSTVAIIFSDLDDFKEINDAWGHDAGNRVLVMFADVLRAALRREDTAARYGGDEFVCVLPGADREQAEAVAERIRQHFADAAGDDPVVGTSRASVSHGIAVYPVDAGSAASAITAADKELIAAKQLRARSLTGRRARPRTRQPRASKPLDAP